MTNKIILSSSTIQSVLTCPRKFILNYASPHRTESLATGVGTAVHQALQTATEHSLEPDSYRQALKALLRSYPHQLFLDASTKERANRSLLSCAVAVENTLQQLNQHGMRLAQINGRPASEVDFLLDLVGSSGQAGDVAFAYSGSIDSVFVDTGGQVIITDYKTTTKDIHLAQLQYQKSLQACIYAIVLSNALGIQPTDIDYQYIIIKLDNTFGEVAFERHRITADSIEDARRYLAFYTTSLQSCFRANYFPPHSGSCTQFNRQCYFCDQCNNHQCEIAVREALSLPDTYRYAYLETGKTDYDIRGVLVL